MRRYKDEPIHLTARRIGEDLFDAACTLQEADHPMPAAMLAYAAIDIMASLARPEEAENVTRDDFFQWTEEYLLPLDDPDITSEDIYSARCGLLHTHSPKSSLTRRGKARPIWYTVKDTPPDWLRKLQVSQDEGVKVLHLGDFLADLYGAMANFWLDLETNSELAARADAHRSDLLRYYPLGEDDGSDVS